MTIEIFILIAVGSAWFATVTLCAAVCRTAAYDDAALAPAAQPWPRAGGEANLERLDGCTHRARSRPGQRGWFGSFPPDAL
jgi:hypothetical protein